MFPRHANQGAIRIRDTSCHQLYKASEEDPTRTLTLCPDWASSLAPQCICTSKGTMLAHSTHESRSDFTRKNDLNNGGFFFLIYFFKAKGREALNSFLPIPPLFWRYLEHLQQSFSLRSPGEASTLQFYLSAFLTPMIKGWGQVSETSDPHTYKATATEGLRKGGGCPKTHVQHLILVQSHWLTGHKGER